MGWLDSCDLHSWICSGAASETVSSSGLLIAYLRNSRHAFGCLTKSSVRLAGNEDEELAMVAAVNRFYIIGFRDSTDRRFGC